MRIALLALALVGLLGVAVALSAHAWSDMGDVEIGPHGILALALGALVSLGLGVGLMALVFHSARSGHDERQGRRGD